MRGAACLCVAGWTLRRQEDSSTVLGGVRMKKMHITCASKELVPASRVCYFPPDSKPGRGRCQRTGRHVLSSALGQCQAMNKEQSHTADRHIRTAKNKSYRLHCRHP